jgi:hypothetical protein
MFLCILLFIVILFCCLSMFFIHILNW